MFLHVKVRIVSSVCKTCKDRLTRGIHLTGERRSKLLEVGKFEPVKVQEEYGAAQFFLHRVFGYRGVTLFPWPAQVYDRDVSSNNNNNSPPSLKDEDVNSYDKMKTLRSETQTYYQVLIDQRDFPYIKMQPEAVTFLADRKDASLYSIPGLDYVSHDDILPYTSTSQDPFQHELFDQFLTLESKEEATSEYTSRETLIAWRNKNHKWLELTEVRRETTNGIRVTVMPFYMGARDVQQSSVYWWRYSIRLENLQKQRVQLRERHWRIFSSSGTLETAKGRGVIGQEPVLSARQPAFQYSSHVSLNAPSGHMWGTFRMERQDGLTFDIRVPPFSLDSREDESRTL